MNIEEINPEVNAEVTVALQIMSPKKAKSRYWKYFGFWADENGTILDKEKVVCKLCHKTQRHLSNTTNLRVHLKAHHKVELAAIEADINEQNAAASQAQQAEAVASIQSAASRDSHKGATIVSLEPVRYVAYVQPQASQNVSNLPMIEAPKENDAEKNLTSLSTFLCRDLLPVTILEGEGFQKFVQTLKPDFSIPSGTVVKDEISKVYTTQRSDFMEALQKTVQALSLSMEIWSLNNDNYATLTAHYITPNWTNKSKILQTQRCKHTSSVNYFSTQILPCMEEWQLEKSDIVAITVDNAIMANMKGAEEQGITTVQCFGRLINQTICQAFQTNQAVVHALTKLRALAEFFSSSRDGLSLERKQELFGQSHCRLVRDNPSNWKSTYELMSHTLEQRSAIMTVIVERKLDNLELSTVEWRIIQQVVNVLKTAKATTEALLSQKYPNASMILPLFRLLVDSVSDEKEGELPIVKDFRQNVANTLKTKYQKILTRDLLNFASFCDPRFKALSHLSDGEKAVVKEKIKTKVVKLFQNEEAASTSNNGGDGDASQQPPAKRPKDLSAVEDLFATFFEASSVHTPKRNTKTSGRSLAEKCETEMKNYLAEERLLLANDPLDYWRCAEHRYPLLGKLARRYLSISATCIPSEKVFSYGDLFNKKRASLEPDMVDMLLFVHDYLQNQSSS